MYLLLVYKFCSVIFLVELIFSSVPAKQRRPLYKGDLNPLQRGGGQLRFTFCEHNLSEITHQDTQPQQISCIYHHYKCPYRNRPSPTGLRGPVAGPKSWVFFKRPGADDPDLAGQKYWHIRIPRGQKHGKMYRTASI